MSSVFAPHSETGVAMTDFDWLKCHFDVSRDAYQKQVEVCGFKKGGHILDAGAGPGLYIPFLADAIGKGGKLTMMDLSQDLLDKARQDYGDVHGGCELVYEQGDVFSLSYGDSEFDGYFSGNVAQYFNDDQYAAMLKEAARVVKPGGLVAAKEWDSSCFRIQPAPVNAATRLMHAIYERFERDKEMIDGITNLHRAMSCMYVRRFFRECGMTETRQHTHIVEIQAPMTEVQKMWCSRLLGMLSEVATRVDSDPDFWSQFAPGATGATIVDSPDFYMCEASTVGVGVVK